MTRLTVSQHRSQGHVLGILSLSQSLSLQGDPGALQAVVCPPVTEGNLPFLSLKKTCNFSSWSNFLPNVDYLGQL